MVERLNERSCRDENWKKSELTDDGNLLSLDLERSLVTLVELLLPDLVVSLLLGHHKELSESRRGQGVSSDHNEEKTLKITYDLSR